MKSVRFENTGRRGWFVGQFPEAAHYSELAEVCYCIEQPGQGPRHYHSRCTETVLIVRGQVCCQGQIYTDGDILVFEPGDINDCEYLTETVMVGVKTPAGADDKVLV